MSFLSAQMNFRRLTAIAVVLAFIAAGICYAIYETKQTITISYPSKGTSIVTSSKQKIRWSTTGIPSTDNISVTIRRIPPPPLATEGQEFDPIIFTGLPNTGEADWTVSDMYPDGTYVIGLTAYASVPVVNPITTESATFTIESIKNVPDKGVVGGDRDAHGCIGSAGYTWCAARQACLRPWESYCTGATPNAVTFVCDNEKSIMAAFYPTDDNYADLLLAGGQTDSRRITVPHASSTTGTEYAKADHSFVFWTDGNDAYITEGATSTKTYSGCKAY